MICEPLRMEKSCVNHVNLIWILNCMIREAEVWGKVSEGVAADCALKYEHVLKIPLWNEILACINSAIFIFKETSHSFEALQTDHFRTHSIQNVIR
jgi:hypothetical protein